MKKRSLAGLLVVFGLSVGWISRSPAIQSLRSVDLLLIFTSGMVFGILLASLLHRLRSAKHSP